MMYIILFAVFCGITLTAFLKIKLNQKDSHEVNAEDRAAVLKVLDNYMATFNSKNPKAWQATYHFPHYKLTNGKMSVLERPGIPDPATFITLKQTGWDHSAWDHRNMMQTSRGKVHVDTQFSRYKADGTKIGTYESLYIVTKEDGRWGVKVRSGIAE
ncbi:MAG TPA: hypothetical protein VIM65_13620 [Cyclobacteriaceae bacterium]